MPSMYKSFHSKVTEPKSLALSVEGIKSESNLAVTVTVSLVALPISKAPVVVTTPEESMVIPAEVAEPEEFPNKESEPSEVVGKTMSVFKVFVPIKSPQSVGAHKFENLG